MLSVADLLAKSQEYIETHGWIRGQIRDPQTGAVCSLGAIEYAMKQELRQYREDDEWFVEFQRTRAKRYRDVVVALCKALPGRCSSRIGSAQVIYFNDQLAKDKQEILDAFAKAEKIERAGYDPDA